MIVEELKVLEGKRYEYGFWARHNALGYGIAVLIVLAPMPYTILPLFFDHPPPDKYPAAGAVLCIFLFFGYMVFEFLNRNKYQDFIPRENGLEYRPPYSDKLENLLWSDIKQVVDLDKHKVNAFGSIGIEIITYDQRKFRIYNQLKVILKVMKNLLRP